MLSTPLSKLLLSCLSKRAKTLHGIHLLSERTDRATVDSFVLVLLLVCVLRHLSDVRADLAKMVRTTVQQHLLVLKLAVL
jgi:hypothetical protein